MIALCILCAAVFLFAGYKIVTILLAYNEGQSTYDELSQYVSLDKISLNQAEQTLQNQQTQTGDIIPPSGDKSGLTNWDALDQNKDASDLPVVNFAALQEINDDVVGWIFFPTMDINYPVVQGPNNDHYVHRMFTGKSNGAGSIFMDYRNMSDMSDPHTILYGHHMNDGSMFAKLTQYKKEGFFEEHPTFLYITPDAYYEVEIISAYTCATTDNAWKLDFSSDSDVENWVNSILRRARFDAGYAYESGDQFMTLSTCTYDFENARYVVTGVMRKIA